MHIGIFTDILKVVKKVVKLYVEQKIVFNGLLIVLLLKLLL